MSPRQRGGAWRPNLNVAIEQARQRGGALIAIEQARQRGGARRPNPNAAAIEQAMNIIAPPPDRSAECREVITGAFAVIEARRAGTYYAGPKHLEVLSKPHTKAKKEAAQRLGSALRRLRYVVNTNKDELDFYLSLFPDIDQIDKWIRQCDEVKRAPAPRRARDEPWKRQAAQLAFVLLRAFSGSGRALTVTPKGQFNRLVGVLLGNPRGNYTYICRQTRARNP
jgi:hypothetical protein